MRSARAQRGAALIALVAVLVMAVLAGLVSLVNAALTQGTTARNRNAEVLQQAKAALIGYVAKEVMDLANATPGRLPCPESPSDAGIAAAEGVAVGSCAPGVPVQKTVGRLPWRTLGIDKLVDADAEPLWYAVSPNWVNAPAVPVINPGTGGQLVMDGTADVVAVIFAPGAPISTAPSAAQVAAGCVARVQQRNDRSHVATGGNPDFRDYLECQNATAIPDAAFGTTVVGNATTPVINDQAVYVTARDILNAIQGPVAERMQKTVAPLLNEFSDLWPGGSTFMPYAAAFRQPEDALAQQEHCGPAAAAQVEEGLLPLAPAVAGGTCPSTWSSVTMSGASVSFPSGSGCTVEPSTGVATCTVRYYQLAPAAEFLLGALLSPPGATANVTVQATAPHGAAAFRRPLTEADITIVPATPFAATATTTPLTDGNAQLALEVRLTQGNVCTNIGAFVCATVNAVLGWLVGGIVVTSRDVDVTIPPMGNPVLAGTRLSAQVTAVTPGPHDLVAPAATAANYWFMQNQWYRYTYYAVSPNASAAATGGNLTVSGFPTQFGNTNDKRFVLALMGPPVTAQARGTAAALDQYLEVPNASTTATPRVFAYQVFTSGGNDRVAACPFAVGGTPVCD